VTAPPDKRRQRLYALLGTAALVAVIAAVVLIAAGQDDGGGGGADGEPAAALDGVAQDGIELGVPDAPVTLVNFSDPQCPFCADFSNDVLPELVEEYVATGQVRMELRLLNFIGEDSRRLANAAHAAGEQDGLWTFMDLAFARQGAENSGYAELGFIEDVASDAGLDPEPILTAANFPEPDIPSEEARRLAGEAGIDETPSFLIGPTDGEPRLLELESLDVEEFREAIDEALADADAQSEY
jgi:protein-disulfide isomerase